MPGRLISNQLRNVRWLAVNEISELWAPELGIPASTIVRELRIALWKLEQGRPWDQPIDVNPDTVDLPSPDTLIDRDFIEHFHDKQLWRLPEFWLAGLPTAPAFPGRPSVMNAIVQELQVRAAKGELTETLTEQAQQLSEWAAQHFAGQQTPKPKSVENGIRFTYKTLRHQLSR